MKVNKDFYILISRMFDYFTSGYDKLLYDWKNNKDLLVKLLINRNMINHIIFLGNNYKNVNNIIAKYAGLYGNHELIESGLVKNFGILAKYAAYGNKIDTLKFALEHGAKNFKEIIKYASYGGNIDIIKYFEDLGIAINYNYVARFSATKCKLELLKYALENGADEYSIYALRAAENGCENIINYLNRNYVIDKSLVAEGAALNGYMDLVRWATQNGATNYATICNSAAIGGYITIIQYISNNYNFHTFNETAKIAAENGHINLVKFLIKIEHVENYNEIGMYAAKGGHLDIVKYAYKKGADSDKMIGAYAAEAGHLHIVKWVIFNRHMYDFSILSKYAARGGQLKVIAFTLPFSSELSIFLSALLAASRGHLKIVAFCIEYDLLIHQKMSAVYITIFAALIYINRNRPTLLAALDTIAGIMH